MKRIRYALDVHDHIVHVRQNSGESVGSGVSAGLYGLVNAWQENGQRHQEGGLKERFSAREGDPAAQFSVVAGSFQKPVRQFFGTIALSADPPDPGGTDIDAFSASGAVSGADVHIVPFAGRTDRLTAAAIHTGRRRHPQLGSRTQSLRVMTPSAVQRTPLEENRLPHPRSVVDSEFLDIKNSSRHACTCFKVIAVRLYSPTVISILPSDGAFPVTTEADGREPSGLAGVLTAAGLSA